MTRLCVCNMSLIIVLNFSIGRMQWLLCANRGEIPFWGRSTCFWHPLLCATSNCLNHRQGISLKSLLRFHCINHERIGFECVCLHFRCLQTLYVLTLPTCCSIATRFRLVFVFDWQILEAYLLWFLRCYHIIVWFHRLLHHTWPIV
jgi:hypothetical protein